MQVTPLYAALLSLLFLVLSFRTIGMRRQLQIGLGHKGDKQMIRRMRVHANFAEYVPLTLLLILMMELRGLPDWSLHAAALSLLVGRIVHAYGVSQDKEDLRFRQVGMVLTFLAILGSALALLASYAMGGPQA